MIYLKNIVLKNFRCYRKAQFKFLEGINILVGANAVGKTSVAEAIYYLGLAKSHRTNNDLEMIHTNESFSSLLGEFNRNDRNDEIFVSISEKGKKILKNNKKITHTSDYIGYFNVVMFCPEDLEIIKGSPAGRRKFLDVNISQMNPNYLMASIKYKCLLKERNEILKNISENQKYDKTLFDVINQQLIKEAKVIIKEREDFINLLNPYFSTKTKVISNGLEVGLLQYLPNTTIDQIEKTFEEKMRNDIFLKTTTTGPHRDDFTISLNNEVASSFGSQGQQRTLALSIKLALADLILENSENLIIILDDVFSELDNDRQNHILGLLEQKCQIIITTTTIENLSDEILKKSNIIEIHKEVEDEQ